MKQRCIVNFGEYEGLNFVEAIAEKDSSMQFNLVFFQDGEKNQALEKLELDLERFAYDNDPYPTKPIKMRDRFFHILKDMGKIISASLAFFENSNPKRFDTGLENLKSISFCANVFNNGLFNDGGDCIFLTVSRDDGATVNGAVDFRHAFDVMHLIRRMISVMIDLDSMPKVEK